MLRFFTQKDDQISSKTPYGNNSEVGKYIQSDDAKIYYEIYGQGKPLVAIHGGGLGCPYEIGRFIDYFKTKYQVIVITSRAHGKSEIGHSKISLEQKANDVYNIIKNETKEKVILFGFSDGGYTSLQLAFLHPEIVSKIISIGTGTIKPGLISPEFKIDFIEKTDKKFYEQQLKLMPEPNRWQEFMSNYMKYYSELTFEKEIFSKIQCKVLLISGENDKNAPLDTVIEAYKLLPNKSLCIIPSAGHCCFIDNFEVVFSAVENFLKEDLKEISCDTLLKTSKSWDGVDLPDYLKGKPEIYVHRYTIPPKMKLKTHYHEHMSFGVVVKGQLTIVKKDGTEKSFNEGESFAETVNTIHYGINKCDVPIDLVVFNNAKEGLQLSFKVDE